MTHCDTCGARRDEDHREWCRQVQIQEAQLQETENQVEVMERIAVGTIRRIWER